MEPTFKHIVLYGKADNKLVVATRPKKAVGLFALDGPVNRFQVIVPFLRIFG